MNLVQIAKKALPAGLKRSIKKAIFPRVDMAPPVVQSYICEDGITSYISLNNFYSQLLADFSTQAKAEICLYSPEGKKILTTHRLLSHFGSHSIDIGALLDQAGVRSPYGIVTSHLVPVKKRNPVYEKLGYVGSHFYMFFHDRASGSIAQIHPLSVAGPHNQPYGPFTSSQLVSTQGLAKISVYQYNPSETDHEVEYRLIDHANGQLYLSQKAMIRGYGTNRFTFDLSTKSNAPAVLQISAVSLPSGNSKPMLMRTYHSGVFSMSHA